VKVKQAAVPHRGGQPDAAPRLPGALHDQAEEGGRGPDPADEDVLEEVLALAEEAARTPCEDAHGPVVGEDGTPVYEIHASIHTLCDYLPLAERLGTSAFGESGSPDGMDALNLAYCEMVAGGLRAIEPEDDGRRPFDRGWRG
jgi:hypothetical protein